MKDLIATVNRKNRQNSKSEETAQCATDEAKDSIAVFLEKHPSGWLAGL